MATDASIRASIPQSSGIVEQNTAIFNYRKNVSEKEKEEISQRIKNPFSVFKRNHKNAEKFIKRINNKTLQSVIKNIYQKQDN